MAIAHPRNELLEEETGLILIEAASITNTLKQLASRCIFHNNCQVRWCQDYLFESDNVWMPQRAMIDNLPLNIFINLLAPLYILDGHQISGLLVSHQPCHTEIARANVLDEFVAIIVVHNGHIHGRS
eukprot:Gb_02405 [translate_table: standard]